MENSSMSKLIIMMTGWLDWMNPIPPILAARLNAWSNPIVTFKQLLITLRSIKIGFVTEHIFSHRPALLPVRSNNVVALCLQTPSNMKGNKAIMRAR